jgi:predicted PurR-regulated permease PerM
VGWILVAAAALWLAAKIRNTITVMVLSLLIAYLLNPMVHSLCRVRLPFSRKTMSRGFAIFIVFSLLAIILILVGVVLVPILINQVNNLIQVLPGQIDSAKNTLSQWHSRYYQALPQNVKDSIQQAIGQGVSRVGEFMARLFNQFGNFIMGLISGVVLLFTSLVISIFILLKIEETAQRVHTYLPSRFRREIEDLLLQMHNIFGGFLKGSIILCIVNGILTFAALTLTGLFYKPYSYTLIVSLLAGATYAIPILGVLFSCIIGGILAYLQAGTLLFAVIIVCVVALCNNIVDRFVTPKVMSDAMGVSPLFIIFSAFAGGELLGIWGMILGVPLAAMVKALFNYLHGRFLAAGPNEESPALADSADAE